MLSLSGGDGCHPGMERVRVTLENSELWKSFNEQSTEMIITKTGRRMFPYLRLSVSGLEPHARYFVLLELAPSSGSRYKFGGGRWAPVGAAEPQLPVAARISAHPDCPAVGSHWASHSVLFNRVKLTNNTLDRSGNMVLNSMHKYQPRIHIVMASDVLAVQWSPRVTFTFPETEFMAVTAYQNEQVTKLKIDNNPFAKGFRDSVSRTKKRKAEQLVKPETKLPREGVESTPSVADDSGISSVGSPAPSVTTPPIAFSDYTPPAAPHAPFMYPEAYPLSYMHPPLWPYPYLLPPPPPLYPTPFLPYLHFPPPPLPEPTAYLIDLSVKKQTISITEH